MSEWQVLNDYIYVEGATGQTLVVYDAVEPYSGMLFILGQESHYLGGNFSEDNDWSVYTYDTVANILRLVSDQILAIVNGYAYGPDGQYTFTFSSSLAVTIGTGISYHPVVIIPAVIEGTGVSGLYEYNYDSTIIIDATLETILYESYKNGDAVVTSSVFGGVTKYSIQGKTFFSYTFNRRTFLLSRINPPAYPEELIGQQINVVTGLVTKTLIARPTICTAFAKFSSSSPLEFFGQIQEEVEAAWHLGAWSITRYELVNVPNPIDSAGNLHALDAKYIGGQPLVTVLREIRNEPISGAATTEKFKYLQTIHGDLKYTYHIGNEITVEAGRAALTCQKEFYWNGNFFKFGQTDNKLWYLPAEERYASDYFVSQQNATHCDDYTQWKPYEIIKGTDQPNLHNTYITNRSTPITTALTYWNDAVYGFQTFAGPIGPHMSSIDKLVASFPVDKTFLGGSRLFGLTRYYSRLYYVAFKGSLEAEPTSITSTDGILYIGGMTHTPAMFENGVYLTSGIDAATAISGYINTSLVVIDQGVAMLTSGIYIGNYAARPLSLSGEAFVKLYGGQAFVHGNNLPFRALLLDVTNLEDISYELPDDYVSVSVEIASGVYICGNDGRIYTSSGLDNWELFDTIDPIKTSLLNYYDEFFAATPGGTYSLVRTASLTTPNFVNASTGLPAGVVILDIEEDLYADR